MIIDFHAHAFPDHMAQKTIKLLTDEIDGLYQPESDGTVAGLLKNMGDWGIDISVVMPIATKPSHTKSINEWAAEQNEKHKKNLVCFGSIFPHTDDYKAEIDHVADLELKGLKFHPEYQNFVVDDDKMLKIYDYALGKNLILLFHAGYDPAFPPPFRSDPQKFTHIIKEMRGGTIVAAHLGGHAQWDDVERHLCGTDIYLDTSMGFEYFSPEQFLRILKSHGANKILFASDSPWSNAKTEANHLMSLDLSEAQKEAVLSGNAKRILNI